MRNPATPGAVGELAELVLPWLPPQDLAAAASASRALRAAASSVTAGRAADAAHGLEPLPIPFDNLVDSKPYAYFLYTPFSLTPSAASASASASPRTQPWGRTWARPPGPTWPRSDLGGFPSAGCACAQGACGGARGCPCADPEAEAVGSGAEAGMGSLRECGDGCACGPSCGNRRTLLGVTVRLLVVRHREKGWGLHAAEVLRRGQFVCEYAGELRVISLRRKRSTKGRLSPHYNPKTLRATNASKTRPLDTTEITVSAPRRAAAVGDHGVPMPRPSTR